MKNLIGQKFNKLLVLEKTSQREGGSIVWKCKCDCGKECFASTSLSVMIKILQQARVQMPRS
jgi:hypothetical protein